MKKGVLFLNGDPPESGRLEKVLRVYAEERAKNGGVATVFCTDGAYGYVSRVSLPDIVIGDFDSYAKDAVDPSCEIVAFSADKDYTDGFLAVKIMAARGFTDVEIYGGYGGRPGMQESNWLLLALGDRLGMHIRFCGKTTTYLVRGEFSVRVRKGAIVSVVPFTDTVHILYMKGLKYSLTDYTMCKFDGIDSPEYVMGVSNRSTSTLVQLGVSEGAALVFVEE